jgi:hypothetical protein
MKLGHCCEISRDILAYPYPGRSVKINSGSGFPGQRIAKKLIERVRPGVELVFAIFEPRSELITLDFPTFERPRNATSGSTGAGNWLASLADIMKRAKTRINQFAVS